MANQRVMSMTRRPSEKVRRPKGRVKKRKCKCGQEYKHRSILVCYDCLKAVYPQTGTPKY